MKVVVEYSDGNYWLSNDEHSGEWLHSNGVDIPDDIWAGYKRFCKEANAWQTYMRKLDNSIKESRSDERNRDDRMARI
jgi:hypothetical protein